jgi:hypothetical protein
MARDIFERYYAKKGIKFDPQGNIIVRPEDYSVEEEQLPSIPKNRKKIEPEVLSPEEAEREENRNKRIHSQEIFIDFKTRSHVPAADLVSGNVYFTKDRQTFLFLDEKMIFYNKIFVFEELQKQGIQIIASEPTILWDGKYTALIIRTGNGVPIVLFLRTEGEEVSPIVDYMSKPINHTKTPIIVNDAKLLEGIVFIEDEKGHHHVGIFEEDKFQDAIIDGDLGKIYSGTLVPLSPSQNGVIKLSERGEVIPIGEYLSRVPLGYG